MNYGYIKDNSNIEAVEKLIVNKVEEIINKPDSIIVTKKDIELLPEVINEIAEARVDYFGHKYTTLKAKEDNEFEYLDKGNITEVLIESNTNTGYMKIENSIEGEAKNSVIKGRTLQNICDYTKLSNGKIELYLCKPNTKYTLVRGYNDRMSAVLQGSASLIEYNRDDIYTFITNATSDPVMFLLYDEGNADKLIDNAKCIIIEGDHTQNPPTEYFEGIWSLGEEENKISFLNTGKNLWNKEKIAYELSNPNSWIGTGAYRDNFENIYLRKGSYKISIPNITVPPRSYPILNMRDKITNSDIGSILPSGTYYNSNSDEPKLVAARFTSINVPYSGYFKLHAYFNDGFSLESLKKYTDIFNSDIQLEEGVATTTHEFYKENKIDIILPLENGCKSLPSGVADEKYDNGNYVQIVGREEFNGAENGWIINDTKQASTIRFYIPLPTAKASYKSIDFISNFIKVDDTTADNDFENFQVAGGNLLVRINRTRLATEDLAGFIEWLKVNPIIIYYELQKYITHKSEPFTLATFKEVTHIHCLNNIVPSNVNAKLPVNLPNTLTRLTNENKSLEKENTKLKNEIISATDFLSKQDDGLLSNDLELDFRLFELELYLQTPLKANVRRLNKIAMTSYEMMKALVFANKYNRADFEYKSNRYLDGKRINQEEYNELRMLMDANEVTS